MVISLPHYATDLKMLTDFKRRDRVGEMLREKIALILLHKSRDPRLQNITITSVEISDDLRRAKVFYLTRGRRLKSGFYKKPCKKPPDLSNRNWLRNTFCE